MVVKKGIFYIVLLFLSLETYCQSFTEASLSQGIRHEFQGRGLMGGGCAFFDFDNDGDDDLYLNGGWNGDEIYLNEDGEFVKITQDIGLNSTKTHYTCSISVGDLDNDGYKDLIVSTWVTLDANGREEIARNLLFHNNGNGTFSELAHLAGVHMIACAPNISLGCEFYQATYYLNDDLMAGDFPIKNGQVVVPDSPGLGMELNQTMLERTAIRHSS